MKCSQGEIILQTLGTGKLAMINLCDHQHKYRVRVDMKWVKIMTQFFLGQSVNLFPAHFDIYEKKVGSITCAKVSTGQQFIIKCLRGEIHILFHHR